MARSPTDQLKSLAAYAKKKPSKHGAHMAHKGPSVRSFMVGKKRVEISTTYKVKVNGKPFKIDLDVAPDGTVVCHELPFYRANSAVDVVANAVQHVLVAKMKASKGKAGKRKAPAKGKPHHMGGGH
jgi:hypothetical protein